MGVAEWGCLLSRTVGALLPVESAKDVAEHYTIWLRAALPRALEKKWKFYQV
jgi:hypothetical protein